MKKELRKKIQLKNDFKKYILSACEDYLRGIRTEQDLMKKIKTEIHIFKKQYKGKGCSMKRVRHKIICECGQEYNSPVTYCRDGCMRECDTPLGRI